MRFRFPFLIILLLLSAPSFAESMDDLVRRDGLYYKKFTDVPFTGKIDEGRRQGSMKNGKFVGDWIWYHDSGQLRSKGSYNENGEVDGLWVHYWRNGQLSTKGEFRNGKKEGYWAVYDIDGSVKKHYSGTYKNGEKISD
jgi:antitoxin component YwqK of YwqJK toxin-antitoxin module